MDVLLTMCPNVLYPRNELKDGFLFIFFFFIKKKKFHIKSAFKITIKIIESLFLCITFSWQQVWLTMTMCSTWEAEIFPTTEHNITNTKKNLEEGLFAW